MSHSRTRSSIITEIKILLKNERRRADRLQEVLSDLTQERLPDSQAIDEEREQMYDDHFRKESRRLINWVYSPASCYHLLQSASAGQFPVHVDDLRMLHSTTNRMASLDQMGVLDPDYCLDWIAASPPSGEVYELRRANIQFQKLLAIAEKSLIVSHEFSSRLVENFEEVKIKYSLRNVNLKSIVDMQKTEIKNLKNALNRKPRKRKFYDMDKAKERIEECEKKIKLVTCPICMDKDVNRVFGCGHVVCSDCCSQLKRDEDETECPFCKHTSVAIPLHLG